MRPVKNQKWPGNTSPVVSVLIATYNQENFIAQCLDSVLSQETSFSIEMLVHDDASTDSTADVVKSYAVRYPHLIKPVLQTKNQYALGRNIWPILHKLAKGRFIAYCDGDDFWLNRRKLNTQVSFLAANPEFVLTFHDAMQVDAAGNLLKPFNLPPHGRRDYTAPELRVMRWAHYMLFGTLVHRNVGLEFPPEYNLVRNGDNFMPMLLAKFGGGKYIEEAGPLAYRQHSEGTFSASSAREREAMHLQTYLQIISYFVRIQEFTAARVLSGRLRTLMNQFFEAPRE